MAKSTLLQTKNLPYSIFAMSLALATASTSARAQSVTSQDDKPEEIEELRVDEIVVKSTRSGRSLDELSRSARVFSAEDLAKYNQQSTSVQEILGKTVPGFAPPVTEGSAGSLTLRGRNPLFLIDGVPVASNTNFSRFLDKFDPLTIGRVEVVYGPTSLYGAGATGGVIQFFTQEPADDGLEFSLGGQFRTFATGADSFSADGFSPKGNASVSGRLTDWLSIYGYVSYEDINGVFSANDELITGRSAFANDITYFGKVKVDLTENQSLTAIVNRTELESADRQFELGGTLNSDGASVATEASTVFSYAQPPTNEFLYTALAYKHENLFGGALDALFYYSDSEFLNPGSDVRPAINAGIFPAEWPGLWQTGRINEEYGLRGQYVRDLGDSISFSLGFDYNAVDSTSLLPISSEEGFDETRFFDAAIQAVQTPPFTLDAVGVFLETSYDLTDALTLTGGVRWDRFDYEVIGPYEVVFFFPADQAGVRPGGSGSSDGVSWNVGVNYDVTAGATLFANFSQGFAIPSLGFIGNRVEPGVPVSGSALIDPVITESFEAGVRGRINTLSYALAGYYSTSDFETTVGIDPTTGLNFRNRAPVRVYGTEFSATWEVTDRFGMDGSVTYVAGQVDPSDNGDFIALATQAVPPLKLSLNPRYQLTSDWSLFGQAFYVADRDAGFEAGTDPRAAEGYALFDIGTTYQLDLGNGGAGVINLQVTNLFNEDYIPAGEITFIPGRVRPGPGRAITLSYQHNF